MSYPTLNYKHEYGSDNSFNEITDTTIKDKVKIFIEKISDQSIEDASKLQDKSKYNDKIRKEWLNNKVCGQGNYVKDRTWRMDKPYIPSDPSKNYPCKKCPILPISLKDKKDDEPPTKAEMEKYNALRNVDPHLPKDPLDAKNMCSEEIKMWFPEQLESDPYINNIAGKIDWKSIDYKDTPATANAKRNNDLLKQWITDRMTDKEFKCLTVGCEQYRGLKNSFADFQCKDGNKSVQCKDAEALKNEIRRNRLPSENICEIYKKGDLQGIKDKFNNAISKEDKKAYSFNCKGVSDGNVEGTQSSYIIPAQFNEWRNEHLRESTKKDFVTLDKYAGLLNQSSPEFEGCINDMMKEYNQNDIKLQNNIKAKNSIIDLTDEDIDYITKKLKLFIVHSDKLGDCIDYLYVDTTICENGLGEQMLIILNGVVSVIGYRFKSEDFRNPENKKKIMYIIDQLGPLIPEMIDKLIEVAEKKEKSNCPHKISNQTQILRRMYDDMFKKQKNVVDFDLGLDSMFNLSDKNFTRSVIMSVLSVAFLKFF